MASITKKDGLNYITIDEGRLRALIGRELSCKAVATGNIYLIKGTCDSQTLAENRTSGHLREKMLALPKGCSGPRLGACRHLKGIRWMSEYDREIVASHYRTYSNDVAEKIIALLDGRTDTLIGMEYSTRFNDFNKAKRNLDKFEAVMKATFNINNKERKAIFLTLTSDPNLTDEEEAQVRRQELRDIEKKIAACTSSGPHLQKLIAARYRILGPDFEIADLEAIPSRTPAQNKRLEDLIRQREVAEEILEKIRRGVGVRELERLNHTLSTLNRLERHYDPDGHLSLWDTNRAFSYSWNSFMSWLKKRLGHRPQYVAAFEYTETGLLHCHAIILTPFVDIHEINMEWERIGQGRIGYVYGLKAVRRMTNKDGKTISSWEWRWANPRNKPKDSNSMHGGAYLEKYLKKAAFAQSDRFESPSAVHSPYWAFNKRFWTCSKLLRDESKEFLEEKEKAESGGATPFSFAGIFDRSMFADMAVSGQAVYSYFRYNSPFWEQFHPEAGGD